MDKKILLERRLSNRMSRQELISRGIISESQAGVFVSSNLSQLNRIQKGNYINSRISQRPSKEDLAKLRILNIGLDSNETIFVREKLNNHLKTRPGPLEVFDYLIYPTSGGSTPQNNICSTKANPESMEYLIVNPADGSLINASYGDLLNMRLRTDPFVDALKFKPNNSYNCSENSDETLPNQRYTTDKHLKPNIAKKQPKFASHKKFTTYNFHEYKPQATPTGNRFIKCTDSRNMSYSNHQEFGDHYRVLIEQQAKFLQYEVANRCGGTASNAFHKSPTPQFLVNKSPCYQTNKSDILLQGNSFNMTNLFSNVQSNASNVSSNMGINCVSSSFILPEDQLSNNVYRESQSPSGFSDVHMCSPPPCNMNPNIGDSLSQYSFTSCCPYESLVPPTRVNQLKSCSFENCPTSNRVMHDSNSNILASLMDDENIISDVRSSDYMNSLYSDLSEFEQSYIGFGGIYDFDDFPSISEKVAIYEQLSTNVP